MSRQSLVDDSLRDSSGGVDEFESNYSSQTMLTAGPGLEARSGPKGGRSVQYTSLDEAPVGSEDGSRLKLPLIAKPAWASASSKRLVPLEGSGEGQLASIASPSNLVVKQRAAIPLVDPDAPAPRNQIHSSGESASDEDSDGNVKVPSVPIDPQVIAQYQALLKRKFEEIRYITSIRRPEDVLDAAAVWGIEFFQGMWDTVAYEKSRSAMFQAQAERARQAHVAEMKGKERLIERADHAEAELRKVVKAKQEGEERADAIITEQARSIAATIAECDSKLSRARAELDLCRAELANTQAQWGDAMREAEREKRRLREAAEAARRDQQLANSYMADARAIMMSKYKETVETRHRMATVTFQLDVYKRLSQKLRQEVVQARDELARANMSHLSHLNALRREAARMELQLEDSLVGTGIQDAMEQVKFAEDALGRSRTHQKGLQYKLEFQRSTIASLKSKLAREEYNNGILIKELAARVQDLLPGETMHTRFGLEEGLLRVDAQHPLTAAAATQTEEEWGYYYDQASTDPSAASALDYPQYGSEYYYDPAAYGQEAASYGQWDESAAMEGGGEQEEGDEESSAHWPELAAHGDGNEGGEGAGGEP